MVTARSLLQRNATARRHAGKGAVPSPAEAARVRRAHGKRPTQSSSVASGSARAPCAGSRPGATSGPETCAGLEAPDCAQRETCAGLEATAGRRVTPWTGGRPMRDPPRSPCEGLSIGARRRFVPCRPLQTRSTTSRRALGTARRDGLRKLAYACTSRARSAWRFVRTLSITLSGDRVEHPERRVESREGDLPQNSEPKRSLESTDVMV